MNYMINNLKKDYNINADYINCFIFACDKIQMHIIKKTCYTLNFKLIFYKYCFYFTMYCLWKNKYAQDLGIFIFILVSPLRPLIYAIYYDSGDDYISEESSSKDDRGASQLSIFLSNESVSLVI